MLLCETFPVGPLECNCTILADDKSREALVIDPGGDAEKIADKLRYYNLTVRGIAHTHAHIDHIGATRAVKQAHSGQIYLHQSDLFLYDGYAMQAAWLGWRVDPVLPIDHFIQDGEKLSFGDHGAQVIHTPGHTPGSVCFRVTDAANDRRYLFSGDTLFYRSIGRTDLWGGDFPTIVRSIRNKLYTLEPDTIVIPGHGPNTAIHDESHKNPIVPADP